MDCYKQFKQIPVVLSTMALSQLEYKQHTFIDWGRIGLTIITNSCNPLRVSSEFGLLIRWFRVRAWGSPFLTQSSTISAIEFQFQSRSRSIVKFKF